MVRAQLTITTGTDNFRELVTTSDVFVDKTLFIQEIIDSGDKAILITRPRRWGKSLALDMLKTFLAIEVDANGTKIPANSNRVLFEGGSANVKDAFGVLKQVELAKSKLAHEEGGEYLKAQGNFPVIHISFKDTKDDTFLKVEAKVRDLIGRTFEQYEYLHNALRKCESPVNKKNADKFQRILNKTSDQAELEGSLKFLTELLHRHHGQKVYVLVDEHDAPVNYFLSQGLNDGGEHRGAVSKLITSMLAACGKDNSHLEKIVITGILDAFVKEGGSPFNNIRTFTLADAVFSKHFGFSGEEVAELVDKLALESDSALQVKTYIQDWYNGYQICLSAIATVKMYTPWSVMQYLSDFYKEAVREPKGYWLQSGIDDILGHLGKYKLPDALLDKLKKLSEGESVELNLGSTFNLLHAIETPEKLASKIEEVITYMLLSSGYLSRDGAKVVVPNKEVLEYFKEQVLEAWVTQKLGITEAESKDIIKELSAVLSTAEEFKKKVQALVLDKIDNSDKTESDFQGLIGGGIEWHSIQSRATATHKVLAEKTVSGGRIDNIFYPIKREEDAARAGAASESRDSTLHGVVIIHEYKKLDKTVEAELKKTLDAAMWQILEKGYLSEPLSKKEAHANHTWSVIRLRSVVFIRDETPGGKWSVHILEKELDVLQAETLHAFFSNDAVKEALGVSSKSRKPEVARQTFLTKLHALTGKTLASPVELIDAVITDSASILTALSTDATSTGAAGAALAALAATSDGAKAAAEASSKTHPATHSESTGVSHIGVSTKAGARSVVKGRARARDGGRMTAAAVIASSEAMAGKRHEPDSGHTTIESKKPRTSSNDKRGMAVDRSHDSVEDHSSMLSVNENNCKDCGLLLPGMPGAAAEARCECPETLVGFCTIHLDNPFYSHPQIVEVLKRAKEIGGRDLLSVLAEVAGTVEGGAQLVAEFDAHGIDAALHMIQAHITARTYAIITPSTSSDRRALVVYSDDRDGSVIGTKLIEQAKTEPANPTLRLDPIEGPFSSFIKLVNHGCAAVGELILKAQELLNAVLDTPESTKKTVLTTMLLDIVDGLHTAAPMPFFPGWGGGLEDDPGYGGGGSGGDKKPDGSSNGFGAMFGSSSDNASFDVTNTSLSGMVDDMNGNVW